MMLIFKSAKKLPFPVVRHFQVDPPFFFDKKLPRSKVELEERQIQFASRQKWQPLTIGKKNPTKMIFLRFLLNCCIVLASVSFSRWATNTSQRISRVPFVRLFILIRHNSLSRVYDFLKLLNGFVLAIKLSRKDIRSVEDTY